MLYPERLEAVLRAISGSARQAIEETGSNMLYLVFGFLEWYEDPSSEEPRLAPLIHLPVVVERAKKTHRGLFKYKIIFSGEDITANLSLKEKLRHDFGIDLPPLHGEDKPEDYFKRVETNIKMQPRWKIRRYITLGLLQFGNLLLHLDLDVERWPKNQSPLQHPLLKKLFSGASKEPSSSVAPAEYAIDDLPDKVKKSPVVYDADSSQMSAILDVLDKKNLVIEGPPGTGKSQTITNIIAAALFQKKSVLFVAEKLAALEVVRRNLNRAGLGDFCLELHSHKTQKKRLLNDIDLRLKKRGKFRTPAELKKKIDELEKTKETLKRYTHFVNSTCGSTGLTFHQILAAAGRYHQETLPWRENLVPMIDGLPWLQGKRGQKAKISTSKTKSAVAAIDCGILYDLEEKSRAFLSAHKNILTDVASVLDHPWSWVRVLDAGPQAETAIHTAFQRLNTACSELQDRVGEWERLLEIKIDYKPSEIIMWSRMAKCAPAIPKDCIWGVLPASQNPTVTQSLKDWLALRDDYISLRERFEGCFPQATKDLAESVNILDPAFTNIETVVKAETRLSSFGRIANLCSDVAGLTRDLEAHFLEYKGALDAQLPFSLEGISLLLAFLQGMAQAPLEFLDQRTEQFKNPQFARVLDLAAAEGRGLQTRRQELSSLFHLDLLPEPRALKEMGAVVENANFLSLFDSEWRAARRFHKKIRKTRGWYRNKKVAADFFVLTDFSKAAESFCQNRRFASVLGAAWEGFETDFEGLEALCKWLDHLRDLFRGTPFQDSVFAFFNLPARAIEGIISNYNAAPRGQMKKFKNEWAALGQHLKPGILQSGELLTHVLEKLIEARDRLEVAEQAAREFAVDPETSLSEVIRSLRDGVKGVALALDLERNGDVQALLGPDFKGWQNDGAPAQRLRVALEFSESLLQQSFLGEKLIAALLAKGESDFWREFPRNAKRLAEHFDSFSDANANAIDACKLEPAFWLADDEGDKPLNVIISQTRHALEKPAALPVWLSYQWTKQDLYKEGLRPLIDLIEAGKLPSEMLIPSLRFFFFQDLATHLRNVVPDLRTFNSFYHTHVRDCFSKADRDLLSLNCQLIAAHADTHYVPAGEASSHVKERTDLALLEHEIRKERRHIPIRQLVKRSSAALQALKPCFMMGPLSVAQYLEPGRVDFDLVVMDEASQMKPEHALGAIARGRQLVVVGDPNQLPPTDFFNRMDMLSDDEDDDTTSLEEAESILDVAYNTFRPVRRLKWHYRSKHQSLIAFSNSMFYENDLVVFPSFKATGPDLGVKGVFVPNATCQNGQNLREAEAVARYAIEFMEAGHQDSLGIAAMNIRQAALIEGEFDKLYKNSLAAQNYCELREKGRDPFFIKNLENVQGDERDVILISFTYGPDPEAGKVYQRFGPINSDTGWRRLNVLYTRARKQVVAFSSMRSSDIVAGPGSRKGSVALKQYLEYVETGVLRTVEQTDRGPENDFEAGVIAALQGRGFECVPQVGSAGYFIDVAIKHPERPDTYIAGVECDGAAYHSGKTVRDRDRLRQEILKNLGWKIVRIWSTDWFLYPSREIDRICSVIQDKLRDEKQAASAWVPAPAAPPGDEAAAGAPPPKVPETPAAPIRPRQGKKLGISREEARQYLIELRENNLLIDFPNADPEKSLLRNEMIEALLRDLPYDKEQFRESIPESLRSRTDLTQFKTYFPKIVEILEMVQDG